MDTQQVKAEAVDHQTRHEPAVFVLPVGEDSKALKKAVDEIQKVVSIHGGFLLFGLILARILSFV